MRITKLNNKYKSLQIENNILRVYFTGNRQITFTKIQLLSKKDTNIERLEILNNNISILEEKNDTLRQILLIKTSLEHNYSESYFNRDFKGEKIW